MNQITVVVPRGVSATTTGKWIRRAAVRRLTGHDEQALAELPADTPVHSRVIALLERMVSFEDDADGDDVSAAATDAASVLKKLSLGDRALLLLTARKLIIGDNLSCTTSCPSCEMAMSLDISVEAIIMRAEDRELSMENYELKASGFSSLRVRPLTAEDQDMLVIKKGSGPDALAQELAKACIVRSESALPEILPESLLEAISSRLDEIDPLSNINLRLLCPECGHGFLASLPVEDFVLGELGMTGGQLEREVHWLAFNYHWTEDQILSLPSAKRKRYVELVNATLAGEAV
jgi:hypothetical protein